MEDYYQKYLKYKKKYLELKGGISVPTAARSISSYSSSKRPVRTGPEYDQDLKNISKILKWINDGLKEFEVLDGQIDIYKYIELLNNIFKLKPGKLLLKSNVHNLLYVFYNQSIIYRNIKKKYLDFILQNDELKQLTIKLLKKCLKVEELNEANINKLMQNIKNKNALAVEYNDLLKRYYRGLVYYRNGDSDNDILEITPTKVRYIKIGIFTDDKYELTDFDYKNIPELKVEKLQMSETTNIQPIIEDINKKFKIYYSENITNLLKNNKLLQDKKIKIKNFVLSYFGI